MLMEERQQTATDSEFIICNRAGPVISSTVLVDDLSENVGKI